MISPETLELLEDCESFVFEPLEFAFLGTVRRCGTSHLAAYDLDKVMEYIDGLGVSDSHSFFEEEFNCYEDGGPLFICKMTMDECCEKFPQTQIWVGLDEAFLGVGFKKGLPPTTIFSYEECVRIKVKEILESDVPLEEDEDPRSIAIEDLEFNTLGAYIGPDTPFHLETEGDYFDTDRTEGDYTS